MNDQPQGVEAQYAHLKGTDVTVFLHGRVRSVWSDGGGNPVGDLVMDTGREMMLPLDEVTVERTDLEVVAPQGIKPHVMQAYELATRLVYTEDHEIDVEEINVLATMILSSNQNF